MSQRFENGGARGRNPNRGPSNNGPNGRAGRGGGSQGRGSHVKQNAYGRNSDAGPQEAPQPGRAPQDLIFGRGPQPYGDQTTQQFSSPPPAPAPLAATRGMPHQSGDANIKMPTHQVPGADSSPIQFGTVATHEVPSLNDGSSPVVQGANIGPYGRPQTSGPPSVSQAPGMRYNGAVPVYGAGNQIGQSQGQVQGMSHQGMPMQPPGVLPPAGQQQQEHPLGPGAMRSHYGAPSPGYGPQYSQPMSPSQVYAPAPPYGNYPSGGGMFATPLMTPHGPSGGQPSPQIERRETRALKIVDPKTGGEVKVPKGPSRPSTSSSVGPAQPAAPLVPEQAPEASAHVGGPAQPSAVVADMQQQYQMQVQPSGAGGMRGPPPQQQMPMGPPPMHPRPPMPQPQSQFGFMPAPSGHQFGTVEPPSEGIQDIARGGSQRKQAVQGPGPLPVGGAPSDAILGKAALSYPGPPPASVMMSPGQMQLMQQAHAQQMQQQHFQQQYHMQQRQAALLQQQQQQHAQNQRGGGHFRPQHAPQPMWQGAPGGYMPQRPDGRPVQAMKGQGGGRGERGRAGNNSGRGGPMQMPGQGPPMNWAAGVGSTPPNAGPRHAGHAVPQMVPDPNPQVPRGGGQEGQRRRRDADPSGPGRQGGPPAPRAQAAQEGPTSGGAPGGGKGRGGRDAPNSRKAHAVPAMPDPPKPPHQGPGSVPATRPDISAQGGASQPAQPAPATAARESGSMPAEKQSPPQADTPAAEGPSTSPDGSGAAAQAAKDGKVPEAEAKGVEAGAAGAASTLLVSEAASKEEAPADASAKAAADDADKETAAEAKSEVASEANAEKHAEAGDTPQEAATEAVAVTGVVAGKETDMATEGTSAEPSAIVAEGEDAKHASERTGAKSDAETGVQPQQGLAEKADPLAVAEVAPEKAEPIVETAEPVVEPETLPEGVEAATTVKPAEAALEEEPTPPASLTSPTETEPDTEATEAMTEVVSKPEEGDEAAGGPPAEAAATAGSTAKSADMPEDTPLKEDEQATANGDMAAPEEVVPLLTAPEGAPVEELVADGEVVKGEEPEATNVVKAEEETAAQDQLEVEEAAPEPSAAAVANGESEEADASQATPVPPALENGAPSEPVQAPPSDGDDAATPAAEVTPAAEGAADDAAQPSADEASSKEAVEVEAAAEPADVQEEVAETAMEATAEAGKSGPSGPVASSGDGVEAAAAAAVPPKAAALANGQASGAVRELTSHAVLTDDEAGLNGEEEVEEAGPSGKLPAVSSKLKRKQALAKAEERPATGDLLDAFTDAPKPPPPPSAAPAAKGRGADAGASSSTADDRQSARQSPRSTVEDDWESAANDIASPDMRRVQQAQPSAGPPGKVTYTKDYLLRFRALESCLPLPAGLEAMRLGEISVDAQVGGRDPMGGGRGGPPFDRGMGSRGGAPGMGGRGGPPQEDHWGKRMAPPGPQQGVGMGGRGGPRAVPAGRGGPLPRGGLESDQWKRGTPLPPPPGMPGGAGRTLHKAAERFVVGALPEDDTEEAKKQKVIKGLLNKITPEKYERIREQILGVEFTDPRTLRGLIAQIFDKALGEPTFCEIYARLCADLNLHLPTFPQPPDEETGEPVLDISFRRELLNKCQIEFEEGAAAMLAVTRREKAAAEAKLADEKEEGEIPNEDRKALKMQELQAAAAELKARQRALGNIQFIGQLFKKKMLIEKIMHECLQALLREEENPKQEDIECLCKLVATIGQQLDARSSDKLDAYFNRMERMSRRVEDSRLRFMLLDVRDLRRNHWQVRRKVEGPKTIEEIHKDARDEAARQAARASGSDRDRRDRGGDRDRDRDRRGFADSRLPMRGERPRFDTVDAPIRAMNRASSQEFALRPGGAGPSSMRPEVSLRPTGAAAASLRPGGRIPTPPREEEVEPESGGDDVAEEATGISAEAAEQEVAHLLAEFFIARDQQSVDARIAELAAKRADFSLVVVRLFSGVMTAKGLDAGKVEAFVGMMANLGSNKESPVDREGLAKGLLLTIKEHLAGFTDDNPRHAVPIVGDVAGAWIVAEVVSLEGVATAALEREKDFEPPVEEPEEEAPLVLDANAIRFMVHVLRELTRKLHGAAEVASMWKDTGLSLKDFIPKEDEERADEIVADNVKEYGLEAVV